MTEKQVFVFDVDDTIAESCQPIGPKFVRVMRYLQEQDKDLVFISGSTVDQINEQLDPFTSIVGRKNGVHVLGTSGTQYQALYPRSPLAPYFMRRITYYKETLSQSHQDLVINELKKIVKLNNIETMTTEEDQIQNRESQITLSCLGRHAPSQDKKAYDPTRVKRAQYVDAIYSALNKETIPKFDVKIGGTTSIDITYAGRTKAWGFKKFLEQPGHQDIKRSDCIFFGDQLQLGGNDHSMREIMDCIEVVSPEDTMNHISRIMKYP